MKKRLLLIMLVGVLCLSACSLFVKDELKLEGVVESPILSHYSEVSGKLLEAPCQLGQVVEAGDLVARIDSSELEYRLEQARSLLLKQEMLLADMLTAADPAAVQQARNNIDIAEYARNDAERLLHDAEDNYTKLSYLYENGGISQNELDQAFERMELAQSHLKVAVTQVDSNRQQLRLLTTGISAERVAAAQAEISQMESQIRQMEEQLLKYVFYAAVSGTVISKHYEVGDIVAPGYDLLDVSEAEGKYVSAWLPVDAIYAVEYGQTARILDGRGQEHQGILSWIDLQSEYTPKDMQSSANKNRESVKIRITLDADSPLKPGESVTLWISLINP